MVKKRSSTVPVGFLQPLKTLFHIVFSFIVFYLSLLIFLLPILSIICFRFILSITLSIVSKGKHKLIESNNAFLANDRFANVVNLSLFAYIDGPCDIELLRQRIRQVFTTFKLGNGSRPYEVMLCGVVQKFGFFWWENMRDSFDIKYHIRYLPGCSDPDRIYTETEVLQASADVADDLWPQSKPRWEFLVVPKMKKDGSDVVCSVIHFRFHHVYVDGISAAQIIRLCVADKPAPEFIFDPVNPPIPPRPIWMQLITYLQVIFLGPWATLKTPSSNDQKTFCDDPLVGGKYFGRTTMDIPMRKMREIRRFYKCSTTAIQHYVFTGALRKLAEKKGLPIPDDVLTFMVFAPLPYAHEYPQNNLKILTTRSPIGVNGLERLLALNKVCSDITHPMNYYARVMAGLLVQIIGSLPVALIGKCFEFIKMTYAVTNVPGIKDNIYFNGNSVVNVFGTGPVANGVRYCVGVACYENKFSFGFLSEGSNLIKDRKDFNYLIEEFENEMKELMDSVTARTF